MFEARTDEVGLLGGASQQGSDRWMLVAHVSGPRRLQPEPKQLEAALLIWLIKVRKLNKTRNEHKKITPKAVRLFVIVFLE